MGLETAPQTSTARASLPSVAIRTVNIGPFAPFSLFLGKHLSPEVGAIDSHVVATLKLHEAVAESGSNVQVWHHGHGYTVSLHM